MLVAFVVAQRLGFEIEPFGAEPHQLLLLRLGARGFRPCRLGRPAPPQGSGRQSGLYGSRNTPNAEPERDRTEGAAGGDPVCWLHLVCEACGALIEREGDPHRPDCAATTRAEPGGT